MERVTESLYLLHEGNNRFTAGRDMHPLRDEVRRMITLNYGQSPFVGMLSCSDSRVPVEVIFDQGIGDIFSIRNAGNVCSDTVVASFEMCVHMFETPLLVVMGHTDCGAIKEAVADKQLPGLMPLLIDKIKPLGRAIMDNHPDISNDDLILETTKANAIHTVKEIIRRSELIRDYIEAGKLHLEAAMYHLETGKVEWLDFKLNDTGLKD